MEIQNSNPNLEPTPDPLQEDIGSTEPQEMNPALPVEEPKVKKTNFLLISILVFLLLLVAGLTAYSFLKGEKNTSLTNNQGEERIGEEFENDVMVEKSFCQTTQDCHETICLNKEYVAKQGQRTDLSIDFNSIPTYASCECQNSRCTTVMDQKEVEDIRSSMTQNNEGKENIPNLINYKSEIRGGDKTDPMSRGNDEIGRFEISIEQELITDESLKTFNINLPGELNVVVEKTEFTRCEDNPSIATHLCENNAYTLQLEVKDTDGFGNIYLSGDDSGILFSILPSDLIHLSSSESMYTYSVTNEYLIVLDPISF